MASRHRRDKKFHSDLELQAFGIVTWQWILWTVFQSFSVWRCVHSRARSFYIFLSLLVGPLKLHKTPSVNKTRGRGLGQ